ncbi:putative nucleotidyltransferase component of viral defense system [Variovorax boronicumulans]|uniref:Nucleotidyltransferase component of viral defense system n=2 Tax=Variovorax boronicumulans TaxID=436515 RepID=A0AAW8D6Y2_9BURK|nr:nucleotidyl transferase AbiEii/AbiGii toxin family protein [Variovorax boronicumulans]MDP9896309.1 putative nucleotidyltransferase component of viral defense system [Variovorax boronicumulans]MDQ0056381.1 putative nucleotidyltransferase component of viral defense system [Variovorax boronicumulans]
MKVLAQDRADLIEALEAEADLGRITTALLEKDEHLTDALRAMFALEFECVKLVFCGGTSLSKAHGLIERMSEDADLKMVLTEAGQMLSRTKLRRYLGDEVRVRVGHALLELGLVEEVEKAASLNEHRYMHSQWMYQRSYPVSEGLRPNLQIELTLRPPVLPVEDTSLSALSDSLAKRPGSTFIVPTVSVAETQAEKVLSFLRRFAQHRAGEMLRPWDTALVRHIYDVHCIFSRAPELMNISAPAFSQLLRGDVAEFGRQHPDFAKDPLGVLESALGQVGADEQSRTEYEQNLLPLVYGSFKPPFEEAFASFEKVARAFLDAAAVQSPSSLP